MASTTQPPHVPGSRVSRAEAVARDVEAQILGDGWAPGDRLGTKDDLRQRFGVAVATINEAVRLLERRGLVEARPGPGGGVFVTRSSVPAALKRGGLDGSWGAARFADCLAVRNVLEPLVCREAARRHRAEDIRALRGVVAEMERAADDAHAYLRLNWTLHRRIAKLCRNAPLHSIYLTLLDFLEDGLGDADVREFDGATDARIHRELVAAIADGPGPRLEAAIERHTEIPPLARHPPRRAQASGAR